MVRAIGLGAGGVTVMMAADVNAAARIEDNVIINAGAIVEHDSHIGAVVVGNPARPLTRAA